MTPAEESYAAAWLSEMWKPTREYHQTDGERVAAWSRNTQGSAPVHQQEHPQTVDTQMGRKVV